MHNYLNAEQDTAGSRKAPLFKTMTQHRQQTAAPLSATGDAIGPKANQREDNLDGASRAKGPNRANDPISAAPRLAGGNELEPCFNTRKAGGEVGDLDK